MLANRSWQIAILTVSIAACKAHFYGCQSLCISHLVCHHLWHMDPAGHFASSKGCIAWAESWYASDNMKISFIKLRRSILQCCNNVFEPSPCLVGYALAFASPAKQDWVAVTFLWLSLSFYDSEAWLRQSMASLSHESASAIHVLSLSNIRQSLLHMCTK